MPEQRIRRSRLALILAPWVLVACQQGGTEQADSTTLDGIAPERVADFIHTVIEADRTTYARQVVHRLADEEGVIRADEHFVENKALPLPAQMFRMGAQLASEKGDFRYALVSPWSINKANAPKTEFERLGVEAVIANPDTPYTARQTVAGKEYFMAVYPDIAVSEACVTCHNEHPESPRTDFKLDDVMGGVVITLPLG